MPETYSPPDCDVVVLAGDIGSGLLGVEWALKTFSLPVIYVPGNHEFWCMRTMANHLEDMRKMTAGTHVRLLYNDTVEIGGVRIVGSTLWSDCQLYGNPVHYEFIKAKYPDFQVIWTGLHNRFSIEQSVQEHLYSRYYINEQLARPFEGKTVVVTHHGPSDKSVHERWKNHPMTPAYVSNLEPIITQHEPALWLHGHVHDSFDYNIAATRIRANPRGYATRENNLLYNEQLVIEI